MIEPIGTVPGTSYAAKDPSQSLWDERLIVTQDPAPGRVLFAELRWSVILSFLAIFLFSTNYFSTPGGMSKQKKSNTLYRNSSLENRPEQALIQNQGRRFEIAGSSR